MKIKLKKITNTLIALTLFSPVISFAEEKHTLIINEEFGKCAMVEASCTPFDSSWITNEQSMDSISPWLCPDIFLWEDNVRCKSEFDSAISSFSDVDLENKHSQAIGFLKSEKIVNGYADGTFKPEATISRAEFLKIVIGHLYNKEQVDSCTKKEFSDVDQDFWLTNYACVAKKEGVVNGYSDGSFKPHQTISLAEASKIVFEASGDGVQDLSSYKNWQIPYIQKLSNYSLDSIIGTDPSHILTRGEMASFIFAIK